MKFPTLKNTLLCKLIIYSVIILPFIATIIIVPNLLFIPEAIRLLFLLVFCIAVIIYVTKSYVLLMMMVATLDVINCRNTARKQFVLPNSFSMKSVEDKISGFGKEVQAVSVNPTPQTLRYKSCYSLSAYSKGVEKVIATYYSELLNKEEYVKIVNSAKANAKAIMKKSPRNKAPYSRVTVVVIFAKHLSEEFKEDLFTTVCKTGTIGVEVSVLPCVVDLEKGTCCFNSERLPYLGIQYPARNHSIKIIKRYLFNNKFTFRESTELLDPIEDINEEQSLWNFWRETKKELILDEIKAKKQFKKMKHKDILVVEDELFVKWEERGVILSVELDDAQKTAEIILSDLWDYPKSNKISNKTLKQIEEEIYQYFLKLGYQARFV